MQTFPRDSDVSRALNLIRQSQEESDRALRELMRHCAAANAYGSWRRPTHTREIVYQLWRATNPALKLMVTAHHPFTIRVYDGNFASPASHTGITIDLHGLTFERPLGDTWWTLTRANRTASEIVDLLRNNAHHAILDLALEPDHYQKHPSIPMATMTDQEMLELILAYVSFRVPISDTHSEE